MDLCVITKDKTEYLRNHEYLMDKTYQRKFPVVYPPGTARELLLARACTLARTGSGKREVGACCACCSGCLLCSLDSPLWCNRATNATLAALNAAAHAPPLLGFTPAPPCLPQPSSRRRWCR